MSIEISNSSGGSTPGLSSVLGVSNDADGLNIANVENIATHQVLNKTGSGQFYFDSAGMIMQVPIDFATTQGITGLNSIQMPTGASDGYVLKTDGSGNGTWQPQSSGGVTSFAKSGSSPLTGDVTISAGSNITLSQDGNDIQISASGSSGTPTFGYIKQASVSGLSLTADTFANVFSDPDTHAESGVTFNGDPYSLVIVTEGYYRVSGHVNLVGNVNGETYTASVLKNGSPARSQSQQLPRYSSGVFAFQCGEIIFCEVGDVITFQFKALGSTTVNLTDMDLSINQIVSAGGGGGGAQAYGVLNQATFAWGSSGSNYANVFSEPDQQSFSGITEVTDPYGMLIVSAGVYRVSGMVSIIAAGNAITYDLTVRKNGADTGLTKRVQPRYSSGDWPVTVSGILTGLVADDVLTLELKPSTTTAATITGIDFSINQIA